MHNAHTVCKQLKMGNPSKCYICDTETNRKSSKNIAHIESEHSKRPIARILKRLHNVDGGIRARDGSNICVLCEDCIDKMNAYDAACLLIKQVENELKAIISRTEKRYRNGKDPIKIVEPERSNTILNSRVVTVQPYASDDDMRSDFNFGHNDEHDDDMSQTPELGIFTDTEEEVFDSDDSFVWPKNRASQRKRKGSAEKEKKKRHLYRCIECPADYYNVDDMQVTGLRIFCHLNWNELKSLSPQLHLASHRNSQFRCGLCHMRLTKGRESDGHEDLHLNRPPLQCIFCDESFESKLPLVQHVEMHVSESRIGQTSEVPIRIFHFLFIIP